MSGTVVCTADAAAGEFSVPAAAMANLPDSLREGASWGFAYVGLSPWPDAAAFEAAGMDWGRVHYEVMSGRTVAFVGAD